MTPAFEIALFLVLGRALASLRRLPADMPGALSAWVLYVAWPAAALHSAQYVRWEASMLSAAAWLWSVFAVAIAGCVAAIVLLGWKRATAGAVMLASGTGSTAGFALPFIERYCGADCMAMAIVLAVLGSALAFSVLGVAAGCVMSQGRVCLRTIARRVLTLPPLVALAIGALLPPDLLPELVRTASADLARTLTPVSMVGIGMHLKGWPSRAQLAPLAVGLGFRLVAAPALLLAGLMLIGQADATSMKLLVLLAAMPPLVSAVALARELGMEHDLSARMAAVGAALALMTVPVWGFALERVL